MGNFRPDASAALALTAIPRMFAISDKVAGWPLTM
jgi:hypothetical protein